MLTHQEKAALLRVARSSIAAAVSGRVEGKDPTEELLKRPTGALAAPSGAFVTIHVAGQLRGCIGYIESNEAVVRVVHDVAQKAACEDPRFPPLSGGELDAAEIEISVLSPPQPVANPEEIVVGVHGVIAELGPRRGLLLPQVAVEQGWDRKAFLEGTVRKAGLPKDAWKRPDVQLYTFTAEVFREEVVHHK